MLCDLVSGIGQAHQDQQLEQARPRSDLHGCYRRGDEEARCWRVTRLFALTNAVSFFKMRKLN